MDKRFVDPLSGAVERYTYDALSDTLEVKRIVDVSGNLDHAQELAKDEELTKHGIKNDMWHYAHIPNVILEKWALEGVDINNPKELVKMVNRPDYKYFKTTHKTHS